MERVWLPSPCPEDLREEIGSCAPCMHRRHGPLHRSSPLCLSFPSMPYMLSRAQCWVCSHVPDLEEGACSMQEGIPKAHPPWEAPSMSLSQLRFHRRQCTTISLPARQKSVHHFLLDPSGLLL